MDLAQEGTGDGPKCLGFSELFLQTVGCLPGFFDLVDVPSNAFRLRKGGEESL